MNPNDPTSWETAHPQLDRLLARHISAPRLDDAFDRAVWTRIEAARAAALAEEEQAWSAVRRMHERARVGLMWSFANAAGVAATAMALALSAADQPLGLPALLTAGGLASLLYGLRAWHPVRQLLRELG